MIPVEARPHRHWRMPWRVPLAVFGLLIWLGAGPAWAQACLPVAPDAAALVPAERDDRPSARVQTEARLAELRRGSAPTLLVGDSIFARWIGAEADLGLPVTRFAVGGDRTEHVLDRLNRAAPPAGQVRQVILLIGTNNLRRDDGCTIGQAVAAILNRLRTLFPGARLVVVSILPRAPWDRAQRPGIARANALIEQEAKAVGARYVDAHTRMMAACAAAPSCSLFHDGLHPGPEGYAMMAAAIRPELAR
ncbi:SGNH/GDSL hydrolase family protein [Roseococcus sp.]|uniref:SGNH/GDSL hydrolase family protein n=1 Tax=Roseococcus sp. TaxID=2109646 RepID=UPI003BA98927